MALQAPVEEAERLTDELRDIVLTIRMMPIGATFSRFKRLVRDLSGELHKQIELATEGAETELDKTVIERLGDPLVHLIRNCIDHGIELRRERSRAGKPPTGHHPLTRPHQGANVVISVIDDGAGSEPAAILAKASERGMVPAGAELSDREIYDLIFQPGFSTAEKVTDVSGGAWAWTWSSAKSMRCAARSTCTASPCSRQLAIDLSLPLTLAIIEGLLVRVAEDSYVIPLSAVEECMELTPDRFATTSGRNVIQVRGAPVPLVRLREIFRYLAVLGHRWSRRSWSMSPRVRVGLAVDQVVGNHQTVIKSLGNLYRRRLHFRRDDHGGWQRGADFDLAGIMRGAKSDETCASLELPRARRLAAA